MRARTMSLLVSMGSMVARSPRALSCLALCKCALNNVFCWTLILLITSPHCCSSVVFSFLLLKMDAPWDLHHFQKQWARAWSFMCGYGGANQGQSSQVGWNDCFLRLSCQVSGRWILLQTDFPAICPPPLSYSFSFCVQWLTWWHFSRAWCLRFLLEYKLSLWPVISCFRLRAFESQQRGAFFWVPTNLMDRTMGGRLHTTLSLLSDSPTISCLSHIERHSWHSVSTGNQMAGG